jgi:hypothetical protein
MRKVELNPDDFDSYAAYRLEDLKLNGLQVGERYLHPKGEYEVLEIKDGKVRIKWITQPEG